MASDGDKRQPLIAVHERGGLVFGLREGKLVSINDVESGLACNCVCPNPLCGDRLVAHKGQKLAYHFKHHNRTDCKTGFETGLHMLAKDALAEALEFRLPPYTRGIGLKREEIIGERMMKFDRAELEKRTGRLVPDVILYVDGRPLLVELVVTHWCDQTKIDMMKVGDLSCVEVNLGPYRDIWDMESLREIVVTKARRSWLNNRYAEDKADRIAAERKAKHDQRVALHVDRLKRFYASVEDRADIEVRFTDTSSLKALELGRGIGLEVPGDTCFPDRVGWQKRIVEGLVREGAGAFGGGIQFKTIFGWVKALVDRNFPEWPPKEIRDEVFAQVPEFKSSWDVVRAYMERLVDLRFATTFQNRWALSERLRQRIGQERKQISLREGRQAKISGLVHDILDLVPEGEKRGFDYEAWLDVPCELGLTPREVIDEDCIIEAHGFPQVQDNESYCDLKTGIERVHKMLTRRGRIVDDLFNLPVERRIPDILAAEAFKAEQAEQARIQREIEVGLARQQRLMDTLKTRHPGYDIAALIGDRRINGLPALEAVRADEGVYQRVLNALDQELETLEDEARRRFEEAERKRKVEVLKAQLLQRCDGLMEPQQARLFLTSTHPGYGGRPIENCVDQASFDELWRTVSKLSSLGKSARRR
ncbi:MULTISPECIES: hypothetical protein [Asticcacaulis]|uniref:hypothetical protein n=1 Tax=Asticcacaulis TaxID=76890 RepID=UPI001AE76D6A|nr:MULTISPECIES: hypothetical protein [Asticcacaulis]MBP2159104.1 hypothetical protein [Asticcacaulis solisilvae]MDR6800149.1 hypothetical protein [Asticcacaulis sp. BE141]